MQSNWSIFLSRKWDTDKIRLKEGIAYFIDTDFPVQLLFFPEGTDLSPHNKEKGHRYSSENGLPKYDYVLPPRTKGFALCVKELRKSRVPPTLVNISVGYVGDMPQNESDISSGKWPTEIHFFAEQLPLSSLPSNEEGIGLWLQTCWEKKEKQLNLFYSKNRFVDASYLSDARVREVWGEMQKAILMWSLFLVYLCYQLATNSFYWIYFPIWTTIYLIFNHVTGGIDRIFLMRYKLFSKLKA